MNNVFLCTMLSGAALLDTSSSSSVFASSSSSSSLPTIDTARRRGTASLLSSSSLRRRQRATAEQHEQYQSQQPSDYQRHRRQNHDDDDDEQGCIPANIMDFESCSAFCQNTTQSPLNTFIVLDGPEPMDIDGNDEDLQFCCACFSGSAYCSDDIPECASYANLDDGTFRNINLNTDDDGGFTSMPDPTYEITQSPTMEDSSTTGMDMMMSANDTVSCLEDVNVIDMSSCADYCMNETGDPSHSFGSQPDMDQYYCICSTMSVDGDNVFCSDNMQDGWDESYINDGDVDDASDSSEAGMISNPRPRFNNGPTTDDASSEEPTCQEQGVVDWLTCEQFCIQSTGHSLNTFSTMTSPIDDEPNHCCACYHGDHYCSDNIPSCQSYADLVSKQEEEEQPQQGDDLDASTTTDETTEDEEEPSCLALDVTSSPACGDYCIITTGHSDHAFGSVESDDQYYCMCHRTVFSTTRSPTTSSSSTSNGISPRPRSMIPTTNSALSSQQQQQPQQRISCSDNMKDGWQDFFWDGSDPNSSSLESDVSSSSSSFSMLPSSSLYLGGVFMVSQVVLLVQVIV